VILLRGGTIIDGTGAPPFAGDVLIAGEGIAEVGRFDPPPAARVVDCTGLAVAPGFIDAHSHSDLQVLENKREKISQGVTTEVVGNCGFSPYPAPPDRKALHEFANGIFCGGTNWGWGSAKAYLAQAESAPVVNVVSLVGHGSLRIWQAGNKLGALGERDLDRMEQKLSEALSDGAAGFSTGLMYSPGASAPVAELERLCRVVARFGKIYTTHMRSYSWQLVEAVEEQLQLARATGCRLQISHLQAVGPDNWPKQAQALEKIEQARTEGLDVAFDCYPYTHGSTVLTQLLPQWALEGGVGELLARLSDPHERPRIVAETEAELAQGWESVFISAVGSEANRPLVGKSIAAIANERGSKPAECVMDLLLEESAQVNMLERNQSEENLRQTLSHPLAIVISDGFYVKGRPHPRLHGTFPTLLGEMCRERGWLSLSDAVRKISGAPAERFGIKQRGKLARGCVADVTVFDPRTVGSPATYENPVAAPVGIRQVFRSGRLAAGE
jgi:N-acyl-D-aspartate/D-glutamate deacylase